VLIYEISHNYIAIYLAFFGFMLGMVIGILVSRRMHNISWNAETNKAVTKMDRIGIIILVLYLLFAISRHWILSHWLHGYALTAFSLSVAAGGMLGRLWTTRQKIRQILKQEGFLHPKKE
jgi:protein-S-isoprenylcysteine O-methyltransferase Ste14